jgi:4-hydroxy-4-methyl-2-oxoglutarate aldolase
MLAKPINLAKPGDVIVADMGGFPQAGGFGELLALECVTKEIAGLVTSVSVRDLREIIEIGSPVFAAGISICRTAKANLGSITIQSRVQLR